MADARPLRWLIAAGVASSMAAFAHLLIIWGGPSWYRFFGAGEQMAQAAAGSSVPALVTLVIAAILGTWALYAFSGAGLLPRLPLLHIGLRVIAAIYLLRGLAVVPAHFLLPANEQHFWLWTSAISFGFGLFYLLGVRDLALSDKGASRG